MSSQHTLKKTNPLVKKIADVRDGDNKDYFFVEGEKLLRELFKSSLTPADIVVSPDKDKPIRQLLKDERVLSRVHVVDDLLMARLTDLDHPAGVIALVKRANPKIHAEKTNHLHLILHQLRLPQNLGALLRTAEATGVDRIWTTRNSCDPFSPKSLRGSSGSAFRLSIKTEMDFPVEIEQLKASGVQVLAAVKRGDLCFDQVDWTQPTALLLGNEGAGLSESDVAQASKTIHIPMMNGVESLNVGVAGAICLYEAFRQRKSELWI